MSSKRPDFNYAPTKLPRELTRHYISASDRDIEEMLEFIGLNKLEEVFDHVPKDVFFTAPMGVGNELGYEELADHLFSIASKNHLKSSFIGDGLKNYKVPSIVGPICNIRNLTTAYTPYQPERSQGTLATLWLYSSALSMISGFEAINASLYDRSTCLFEALNCALRNKRGSSAVIVSEGIYPGDIEVLETLSFKTDLTIHYAPLNKETGTLDHDKLMALIEKHKGELAALAFPQMNSLGNLENVDLLTDLAHSKQLLAITLIDPMLLAKNALKPPVEFGQKGADIFVAEGQHLCLGPNYGGPGLGIFGIRYNKENKNMIRTTPGRFVGKGKDKDGKDCLLMVLSTREQHIRRDKATSNICSNQSFVATIAGAALLQRGEKGLSQAAQTSRQNALDVGQYLCQLPGVELAFPYTPFFNEIPFKLPCNAQELISKASKKGIHLGVDISQRLQDPQGQYLLMSFFDTQSAEDLKKVKDFFTQEFGPATTEAVTMPQIPPAYLRNSETGLPQFSHEQLLEYYTQLGEQNVSPDDNIYPLGSCTMKYNPYINDWAASLPGFTQVHPQAPSEDSQGCLEILYEIQEWFKKITGLPGVTTQPVAGAQGELVGLKMFQAYHNDRGEGETRNIVLIPRSAHGTNPATATYAGYQTKKVNGQDIGIVLVEAAANGEMDFDQLKILIEQYQDRIAGIMVTNPNTAGILETKFKDMATLIHAVGGLVYMDGANMNAIAGFLDLNKLGVDAVHNNLHKTWTIPHGGGGPGDAIVAVSEKLVDYLPGVEIVLEDQLFSTKKPAKSIGSIHRHYGNFAHKVRAYTYLKALGEEGIKRMSAVAVLSAQYLFQKLKNTYPTLPKGSELHPRMHEFILSFSDQTFELMEKAGTPKAQAIARIGKLYLDFGIHAPTVAFPEPYGLMIEPTESYSKAELDRFCEVVETMHKLIIETPEVLTTAPHFTPIGKVDEVAANKNLILSERISTLPQVYKNRVDPKKLGQMNIAEIYKLILEKR